jgi:rubrerythrin
MTIEEAIRTAIEVEEDVRDVYLRAAEATSDPTGKRIFSIMGQEEQGHVDYLKSRLEEWDRTGHVTPEKLETVVPSQETIASATDGLPETMEKPDRGGELAMLRKALEAEQKTSEFYSGLVAQLPQEGKDLFARFVEIEDGHLAIVQAEIDRLTGHGIWFDFQEFQL